jgi:hypothetical protein
VRDESKVARCRRRRFEVSFDITIPVWDDPPRRRTWSVRDFRASIVSDVREQIEGQLDCLGFEEAVNFGGKGRVTHLHVRPSNVKGSK